MTSRSDSKPITLVRLYSDGACPGKCGPASAGVVLYDQDNCLIARRSRILGASTVNRAEYQALAWGLDEAAKLTRLRVECYLDSDIVEGQLSGRYRLRDDELRLLFHRIKDLERPFKEVCYLKVRRDDQRLAVAHQLAHDALNGRAA